MMRCCGLSGNPKPRWDNDPPPLQPPPPPPPPPPLKGRSHVKHQPLIQIPGCMVHLMDEGEAIEIAHGNLAIIRISDNNRSLATTIKVGNKLQWPLTKDEPVVKLDNHHYLFTIPMKDSDPLSYGVSFSEQVGTREKLATFDSFLRENSCFSCASDGIDRRKSGDHEIDWKEFAPKIEGYNGVLAKAIANGTGQIIRGIFICSNAYANQVQRGGELILNRAKEEKKMHSVRDPERLQSNPSNAVGAKNNSALNNNLKRARNLSTMTEKMSKAMLDTIGVASGSAMGPLVRSKTGQAFFSMMPGEVLLASLDAVGKILNAAEAAEKQTLRATSGATVRVVSEKYGESAGEAAGDALATAGNVVGTAWNVAKIRKAINPAASASSGLLKDTQITRKRFQMY